jgi:serine/threonine protein kinase
MAEVFLARRPGPEGFAKRVAIKRILPHLAKQPDFVAMFLDEARLAAALDHPHIVHLHDFGVDDGAYYLAMEYVCGEDLSAIARRAHDRGAPLPVTDVATILIAACEALHHAHERGIVHRDVTPANLLVSYDGVVKLADFGIAKSQTAASHTNTGTLKGKIPYMSPEQARAQQLDRKSDVFSLGIVAWELLTGKRLFHRRNELDMLRAVQSCDVAPLVAVRADVPPALAAAIGTALAPDRDARWATAAQLGEALSAWLTSIGEAPSKPHLAKTMARLFGADAAERRLAAATAPSEATAVNHLSLLHPARWIQPIAMHLHLPPPRMPPLRLLGPALALLLSAGGLLFGLHSPHARPGLSAGVGIPPAVAPTPQPQPAPRAVPVASPASASAAPVRAPKRTPRGKAYRNDRRGERSEPSRLPRGGAERDARIDHQRRGRPGRL